MIGRTNATFSIKGGYVRPLEWLQIEHLITEGEEKMVGLYAVWDAANVANNYFNNYCTMVITGNCTVDWGDGTVENFASNANAEHVYDYDDLPDSTICEGGYKQAIITVTPQDGQHITQYNLGNKHSADIHYQSSSNWLDISISGTHISRILMYNNCKAIFLEKFKAYQQTTLCTNMQNMFFYCTSLQSIDLSSFNTSNVTTMANMFNSCNSLQSIDLSSFNTSNVTTMQNMFYSCTSLQSIDLSSFNTSNVTTMASMFYYCTSLQSIDLSSFNTSNVTTMSSMFNCCYSLQSIDLSSFNTSNVTNMSNMFNYCYSLQSIDLSLSNLNSITNNTSIMQNNYTLSMCRLPNIPLSFSIVNSNMDAANINALFTDLRDLTGFAQQTINVKGNPGAATCTTSIATDKNWIVITA